MFSSACSTTDLPPLPTPTRARPTIVVRTEFRVGVFDFFPQDDGEKGTDSQLGANSMVLAAVSSMLLTELRDLGRFSVYQGRNVDVHLKGPTVGAETLNESTASNYVDAYLTGALTGLDASKVCFDFRLSNAWTHEVLYSLGACIPSSKQVGGGFEIDRSSVRRVAEELSRSVRRVGNGRVTAVDGNLVEIDKGAEAGVQRGMFGYLSATGNSQKNPDVHDQVRAYTALDSRELLLGGAFETLVGELYIVSVEREASMGLLIKGGYGLPGDTVFFK